MTKQPAATNARNFRTFLLVQQFERQAIGQRIAQARKEHGGMTQEQLAELLNVSTRSIQNFEAGETMPWKYFQTLEIVFKRRRRRCCSGCGSGEVEVRDDDVGAGGSSCA